jgi:hypothetical protein
MFINYILNTEKSEQHDELLGTFLMTFNSVTGADAGRKGGVNRWRNKNPASLRTEYLPLRVSKDELALITDTANQAGLSRVELVIQAVRKYRINRKPVNAMPDTTKPSSLDQIKNLFWKLRLCAPAWIDIPLDGIREAADMAEEFTKKHSTLFWNTPDRKHAVSDDSFVSFVIDRSKHGTREQRQFASSLIDFLEKKNAY